MTQKRTLYNILLWIGLYFLWVMVFQKRAFSFSRTMTIQFCYLLFIAGNYYFNVYYTIPVFLYRKRYAAFALLFLAGIVVASLLRVPLATYLNQHYFAPGKPPPGFSDLFFNSLINIFIWTICLVAAKLIMDRIRFQKYVEVIEKEKMKNELDFLKAQFNPHFLFNSINSIYGNINKNNSTAREMLLTFSEMLRYQLYECNTSMISIEKEIGYIRNYITLQQIRKPENLSIQLQVSEEVRGITIAPLIFIAFIENSFKYVSNYEDKLNEVRISLARSNNQLFFKTFNTKENNNGRKPIDHGGIGIANVKRRLELLYPGKHALTIQNNDHSFEVILNLEV
jgi:two-component system, LytTR family, sensor kinase